MSKPASGAVLGRMQLTLHATHQNTSRALCAWCMLYPHGPRKPDVLRPGIVGMRASTVIRLRPCMIPSIEYTPPPAARFRSFARSRRCRLEAQGGKATDTYNTTRGDHRRPGRPSRERGRGRDLFQLEATALALSQRSRIAPWWYIPWLRRRSRPVDASLRPS